MIDGGDSDKMSSGLSSNIIRFVYIKIDKFH